MDSVTACCCFTLQPPDHYSFREGISKALPRRVPLGILTSSSLDFSNLNLCNGPTAFTGGGSTLQVSTWQTSLGLTTNFQTVTPSMPPLLPPYSTRSDHSFPPFFLSSEPRTHEMIRRRFTTKRGFPSQPKRYKSRL